MRSLFFVLLLGTSFSLFAQSDVYRFGRAYSTIDAHYKRYVSDTASNTIIAIKEMSKSASAKRKVYIQTFDAETLKETNKKTVYLSGGVNHQFMPFVFNGRTFIPHFPNGTVAISSNLRLQEIDPNTAAAKGKPIPLGDDKETKARVIRVSDDYILSLGLSPKVVVKPPIAVTVSIFDKDLKRVASSRSELPYDPSQFLGSQSHQKFSLFSNLSEDSPRMFHVGKDKTVYMLMRGYNTEQKEKAKAAPKEVFHLELVKIDPTDGSFTIHPIDIKDKTPLDYKLMISPSGELFCVGYYKNNRIGGVEGAFAIRINADGSVHSQLFHEIPVEVLSQNTSQGQQRKLAKQESKGKAVAHKLGYNDCHFLPDGGIIIRGEMYNSMQDFRGSIKEHIILTKLNADGTLAWTRKLPKRQLLEKKNVAVPTILSDYHSNIITFTPTGYSYIYDQGKHYCIYLDHENNETLNGDEKPKDFVHAYTKDGVVMVTSIDDKTGEVSKKAALSLQSDTPHKLHQCYAPRITPTGKGKVLIEAYIKNGNDILVEIDLRQLDQAMQ